MKIVMVVEAWFPHVGGGQVHAWELSKALAKKGNEVVIITRNNGEWNENFPGVRVVRLGHFKNFPNLIGRLEFLVLAYFKTQFTKADVIHLHAFSPGLLAPFLKFFTRKPVIFTVHGEGFKLAGLPFKLEFLQNLVFYRLKYDGEITVAKQTLTEKPITKKVWIIPNGVNIEEWKGAQRERKNIKHLVFVGRLVYDKGVDLLIEAFKNLDNKNLDLTIIGEGPEAENLKKMARGLKVKFLGRLEGKGLVKELKKMDLYVMPSRVEGMPIRLLEAWSSKIPVLATKVGDNDKYIKEGKTGFLANADILSLEKAIKKILGTKKINRVVDSAYDEVKEYSWDKISDETLNKYKIIFKNHQTLNDRIVSSFRSNWLVWSAAVLFVVYKFWLVTVAWSGRSIAPEPDDSFIYIGLIRLLSNHGFLGPVAGIHPYTLADVLYLGYSAPLAIFSKLTGISSQNTFHLFFYLGTVILVASLIWVLKRLVGNKDLLTYVLLFMALYNGSGNYHGFYWMVPSFISVMIYFILFGMLFWESRYWYFLTAVLTLIFVLAHPISVFASLVFAIWLVFYSLISWKIDWKLVKKVTVVIVFSVVWYASSIWFYASKGVEITGEFSYLGAIRAVGYFINYFRAFLSQLFSFHSATTQVSGLSGDLAYTVPMVQTGNWDVIKSDYLNILFPNPFFWLIFLILLYFVYKNKEFKILSLYLANVVFVVVSTWAWVGFRALSYLWPTTFLVMAFGTYFAIEFFLKKLGGWQKNIFMVVTGIGIAFFVVVNVLVSYVWARDLSKNNNLVLDVSCVNYLLDNTTEKSTINYANKTAYSVFRGAGLYLRRSNLVPEDVKDGEYMVKANTKFEYYQPDNSLIKFVLSKTSRKVSRNVGMEVVSNESAINRIRDCGDFTISKVNRHGG